MLSLNDMPIGRKLTFIVMAVCGVVLLLSSVSIGIYEVKSWRELRIAAVSALAEVVGQNSSAALVSRDRRSSEKTLSALGAVPHVASAVLYDADGRVFAKFRSPSAKLASLPGNLPSAEVIIADRQLLVSKKIILAGDTVGTICIQSDMTDIIARLKKYALIIGLIVLAAGIPGFMLNARLQRVVTDPIMGLVRTVNSISTRKDYTIRAAEYGKDELGTLIAGFNDMLAEIQKKEAALQQVHNEMEERVINRTRELELEVAARKRVEEELQGLLQKVESANKELNDFAYVVSHDLKAPIRAIGSLASWLATDYADKLDTDGKEKLDLLIGRTKRMHDLINGILEYSRVGRVKDQTVDTNLNELLKEVVDTIAAPENIQIMIHRDLPTVRYDRTRLVQVFQNLIGNAVKYMDKPKGIIKMILADEGSYWQFTIKDNGPGIHWKYFDKIFQLFQTLAPRDRTESTGVGLAVVKKIVTMWGGRIWVESEVGTGSSFIFTLPKT